MTGLVLLALLTQEPSPVPREDGAPPSDVRTVEGISIQEPKKTKHAAPKWPDNALRAGMAGAVVLEGTLGLDGAIESVKVVRGPRALADAASAAVRKWRYEQAQLDGKPVRALMTITTNFRLEKPPTREDVLSVMDDPDAEIRSSAVRWLGRYRPVTGEQKKALDKAAKDKDEVVAKAARDALAKIDGP
jgi:TonB family protein